MDPPVSKGRAARLAPQGQSGHREAGRPSTAGRFPLGLDLRRGFSAGSGLLGLLGALLRCISLSVEFATM